MWFIFRHVGSGRMCAGRHHGRSHVGGVGKVCLPGASGAVGRTGRRGGQREAVFGASIIRGSPHSWDLRQRAWNR